MSLELVYYYIHVDLRRTGMFEMLNSLLNVNHGDATKQSRFGFSFTVYSTDINPKSQLDRYRAASTK